MTSIGESAFTNCGGLTSVTIPSSVTSIGDNAFHYCGVTSVTIPSSVTYIGRYVFSDCFGLTSLKVESGNTTYDSRDNCNAIIQTATNTLIAGCKNTVIPSSVTSIGSNAFAYCSGLTSVTIPNSVMSIGNDAFHCCRDLTSVNILEGVTSIGRAAFAYCSGLTSVTIPNSVTSIANQAFRECSGLTSVTIPNSVTNIEYNAFENCISLTSVIIPNSVTSIESQTFKGCSSLASVTIPNSVTSIDGYAFYNCIGLTSVIIPSSVTSIGDCAFRGCSGLTSVVAEMEIPFAFGSSAFYSIGSSCVLTVPYGTRDAYIAAGWTENVFKGGVVEAPAPVSNIVFADANVKALCVANWDTNGDGELSEAEAAAVADLGEVFEKNTNITSFDELQYFTGLTSIGDYAFYSCSGLTSIDIPNSVTSIGDFAFWGCSGLTSLTIPSSVTSIGNSVFGGCSGLTSIKVESGNTIYDSRDNCNAIIQTPTNRLIAGCKNTVIPSSVTSIGYMAFYGCSGLSSVIIPNFVTSIGDYAFDGCSSLTSVTIPNSVKKIGHDAFSGCSSLSSVIIPSSVTSIGYGAFSGCSGLTSVTIPNSVTSIGNGALKGCSGLTSIKVESGNTIYDSRDNCNAIIQTETNILIAGCKNTVIPSSVTSIGAGAFRESSGLTSVTIPENVTSIGAGAFRESSGLTSVTIPESVTSIGDHAFYECSGLTTVVAEMETPFAFGSDAFKNIGSSCVLTVPYGTRDAYIAAGWTEYVFEGGVVETPAPIQNIEFADTNVKALCVPNWDTNGDGELSEAEAAAVTDLGEVFKGNTTIQSFDELQYFTGLTSIGVEVFDGCRNLASVMIPNSVITLGRGAFYNCTSLASITIPASVTGIGEYVFSGLSAWVNLTSIVVEDGNPVYDSRNNCNAIIETSSNKLIVGCANTVIPSDVTSIENGAFEFRTGLTSISLPAGLTSIGDFAFKNCTGLSSIEFPDGLTKIGKEAFLGCIGLTSVTIPGSVTDLGIMAFESCTGLTTIDVTACESIIRKSAFFGCDNLKRINNWTTTSSNLFHFNSWSAEEDGSGITIPFIELWRGAGNMLTNATITHDPITGLTPGLYTVKILARAYNEGNSTSYPSGITFFANDASVKLSDVGMRSVYNSGIVGLSTLLYGELSLDCTVGQDGVLNLSFQIQNAVGDWLAFKNLEYELKVNNIDFADANVKALCVANWDTNGDGELSEAEAAAVRDLGEVFKEKTIQSFNELRYFTGLKSIGNRTFKNCSGLTSVTIPNSVTSIGDAAFGWCSGLTSVTIPNSVTSIGQHAFDGCSSLTSVTIPNSVTSIGGFAFSGCSGLTSVNIPSSVTSIESYAFSGCSSLTSVKVASGNPVYDSRDNCNAIIKTATNTLISGCKSTVIPSSVTSIGSYAFYNCSGLTSVTIPNSVTSIGELAFYGCSGLTSVVAERKTPFAFGKYAFSSIGTSCVLTVPAGTRDAYIAKGWTENVFKGGIVEAPAPVVLATSVTINEETLILTTVGETATLTATVVPENVTDGSVTWTSSDESVATVSNDGVVTAVANGTATITATTNDGSNLSATCTVTVDIPTVEPDTDISGLDNVIYMERTEAIVGTEQTLSVRMKNTADIRGFQFTLHLPEGVTVVKDEDDYIIAELAQDRLPAKDRHEIEATEKQDGSIEFLVSSTRDQTFTGNDGEIMTIAISIADNVAAGDYPLTMTYVKLSESDINSYYLTPYVKTTLTISDYMIGDINGDNIVDISDYIGVANYILGNPPTGFIEKAGDVNADGIIDISDYIGVANIILYGSPYGRTDESKLRTDMLDYVDMLDPQ